MWEQPPGSQFDDCVCCAKGCATGDHPIETEIVAVKVAWCQPMACKMRILSIINMAYEKNRVEFELLTLEKLNSNHQQG